jgi:hypothetical protein
MKIAKSHRGITGGAPRPGAPRTRLPVALPGAPGIDEAVRKEVKPS